MSQTTEAQAFLRRLVAWPNLPSVSLDEVLVPSLEDETALRRLFAIDRSNKRLSEPYVGLVNVFSAPDYIRKTRTRVVQDDVDKFAKYVMPLPDERRRSDGDPSMVQTLEEFQRNWSIFTEGSLSLLTDWSNVVAAGGSVLGCLLPMSDADKESRRTIRKYYHAAAYPTSDVDLFLWGLTPEQAEVKINAIYEAVRDSVPWDVTCIRTKSAITIYSQYPYRCIQIVLRLYHSPAEILAGFDVDAPCVAYDGKRVLASPRAIIAMMRQAITIDMTRRSPSYEIRLAKYAARGFEVYVPDLRRADIDPSIYERALNRIEGLARLLVLEKLSDPKARTSYLESRRSLRSRPQQMSRRARRRRRHRGDLKADDEIAGLETSDYDTAALHIPYGPGWTAKRIEKLIFGIDLGTNSTFNPKNKGRRLHRHAAFFGTGKACLEDLCGYCPEPLNKDEWSLQHEEDKHFIRGRIAFIREDPGRQTMTGSFNPVDVGEWSGLAYIGQTEKLFNAIAAHERVSVQAMLTEDSHDLDRRDHVGRTPLHVAILSKASGIARDIIDVGARITPRLANGRSALHLAAQMDLPEVLQRLLERSEHNADAVKNNGQAEAVRTDVSYQKTVQALQDDGDLGPSTTNQKVSVEDDLSAPDILDLSAADWDLGFTPLAYAITAGSLRTVNLLLGAGADANQVIPKKRNVHNTNALHTLSLALITPDKGTAKVIVQRLLQAGAVSSQAGTDLVSSFHTFVASGRCQLVEELLEADPSAAAALNVPAFPINSSTATYPIVTAVSQAQYAITALLLGHGAKIAYSAEEIDKAKKLSPIPASYGANYFYGSGERHPLDYLVGVYLPVEVSLASANYLYRLMLDLGAQFSVPTQEALKYGRSTATYCKTILDITQETAVSAVNTPNLGKMTTINAPDNPRSWADHRLVFAQEVLQKRADYAAKLQPVTAAGTANRIKHYYKEAHTYLSEHGALSWNTLYPTTESQDASQSQPFVRRARPTAQPSDRVNYMPLTSRYSRDTVLPHLLDRYDALFEACWKGDNKIIRELCLPSRYKPGDAAVNSPIQIAVKCSGIATSPGMDALSTLNSLEATLIMKIATLQWKRPDEEREEWLCYIRQTIDDGEDMNSDDELDDEIDGDIKKEDATLDIASLQSAVQCDVKPDVLLETSVGNRLSRDGTNILPYARPLHQALADGDLETFVHISKLMRSLPEPKLPQPDCLNYINQSDNPELLDEYIRITGDGIALDELVRARRLAEDGYAESEASQKEAEAALAKTFYLGLTVDGKKRKDLARYVRNAPITTVNASIPLLWQAARYNATHLIDYLASQRPLAAYRYYAQTAAPRDEKAEALRKMPETELEKLIPKVLGFAPNSRRETVVTAAIVGRRTNALDLTKRFLALSPSYAQDYLHKSIRLHNLTPFLLATFCGAETAFLDFLLANGVSADATDARGFNVFHIVCGKGYLNLLKYFLEKLPIDLKERLLLQPSRGSVGETTPLMLAVKRSHVQIIEELVKAEVSAVKTSIDVRDARGSNALHVAVHNGQAEITKLLIECGGPELLYVENTIGETPLETAAMQYLTHASRNGFIGRPPQIRTLSVQTHGNHARPPSVDELEKQLTEVKEVFAKLEQQGRLIGNPKLKGALNAFVEFLDAKLEEEQVELQHQPPAPAAQGSQPAQNVQAPPFVGFAMGGYANGYGKPADYLKTLEIVTAAAQATPGTRCLVNVADVQRSVNSTLQNVAQKQAPANPYASARRGARRFAKASELPDEEGAEEDNAEAQGVLSWSAGMGNLSTFELGENTSANF